MNPRTSSFSTFLLAVALVLALPDVRAQSFQSFTGEIEIAPGYSARAQFDFYLDSNKIIYGVSFRTPGILSAAHIHADTGTPFTGTAAAATSSLPGFPSGERCCNAFGNLAMNLASSWNPNYITSHGGTQDSALDALYAAALAGKAYLDLETSGGNHQVFLVPVPVPEPASIALTTAGALVVFAVFRRTNKKAAHC